VNGGDPVGRVFFSASISSSRLSMASSAGSASRADDDDANDRADARPARVRAPEALLTILPMPKPSLAVETSLATARPAAPRVATLVDDDDDAADAAAARRVAALDVARDNISAPRASQCASRRAGSEGFALVGARPGGRARGRRNSPSSFCSSRNREERI
jgi:hypothetical protein